jgi:hypothetical protein
MLFKNPTFFISLIWRRGWDSRRFAFTPGRENAPIGRFFFSARSNPTFFISLIWRRGWDSNPRTVARQLISSQPRYDHFDTSPDLFYLSISDNEEN